MSATDTPVADERQLREFGYEQELKRGLSLWSNFAVGFATVSPVVGFYAIITLSSMSAGTAWVWVLPVVLVGQLLIATVYAELASQFPIAGGAYQWARRLLGPGAGWFAGFVYVCALTAALATVAYTGSIWISVFFGTAPSSGHLILFGTAFLLVCLAVNLTGVDLLRRIVNAGITAEIVASVGVGLVLFRRPQRGRDHPCRSRTRRRWSRAPSSTP